MDEASERYPGKRSGMPQQEIYTSVAFHQSLQPVIDRLKAEQSEVLTHFPSARELAKLVYDVLGFLESAYGRHALTKPFPKLPYYLFQDTRAHGAVDILLRAVAEHVKKVTIPVHNRKKIDWTSPALRKELQELLSHVRTELVRAGCIKQFKVYFDGIKNIENLQEMKQSVTKLGGQVASHAKEAGVTHIVVPNAKDMKDGRETRTKDPGMDEYFWRTVAKHDGLGHALVHWWYLPDSYNEFVPYASAPEELDADEVPPSGRPWVLHERWVVDSDTYNEWMNEGDYETEASAEENKRLREARGPAGEGQAAANEPQRKKTKKELKVEEAAAEVGATIRRVLAPGVVEREVKIVDRRAIEAVHVPTIDLSHGYRQQWMGAPGVEGRRGEVEQDGEGGREKRHAVPFAAGWFNKKTIHHIELREFLEFQKDFKGPSWTDYRYVLLSAVKWSTIPGAPISLCRRAARAARVPRKVEYRISRLSVTMDGTHSLIDARSFGSLEIARGLSLASCSPVQHHEEPYCGCVCEESDASLGVSGCLQRFQRRWHAGFEDVQVPGQMGDHQPVQPGRCWVRSRQPGARDASGHGGDSLYVEEAIGHE